MSNILTNSKVLIETGNIAFCGVGDFVFVSFNDISINIWLWSKAKAYEEKVPKPQTMSIEQLTYQVRVHSIVFPYVNHDSYNTDGHGV